VLLNEKEAKAICEKLLRSVKADDAIVRVTSEDSSHLRFAANAFTTSGRSEDATARVTVWIEKKRGETSTNELDDASLRAAVEQAEQLARIAPVDREYLPTLSRQSYRPVNGYAEAASNISNAARAKSISDVIAACEKDQVVGAGFHEARASAEATATKNGNFDDQRRSFVGLSVTARTAEGAGSGYFQRSHFDPARLDTQRIAREAIRKALTSRNSRPLEPGVYSVLLEPQAVGDLLSFFAFSFDARRADEGRSPFSKSGGQTRLGEQVFDERIHLYSDPWNPEIPGSHATRDGIPAEKIHLVRNGVVENLIYSRFWAREKDKQPTPGPVNTILESAGPAASIEEMIERAERCLLVSRFFYIRSVDPRTALLTGLTRDGVWSIENGKIARAVRNFRFNQSVLQMLAPGNVERIGAPERVEGEGAGGNSGGMLVPALQLKRFHFTSQSEAI